MYRQILGNSKHRIVPAGEFTPEYAESRAFVVLAGHTAIVHASGFQSSITVEEETFGDGEVLQQRTVLSQKLDCAELIKLLYETSVDKLPDPKCGVLDDYTFELERDLEQRGKVVEPFVSQGCNDKISACDNVLIITVPGIYAFRMANVESIEEGARLDLEVLPPVTLPNIPPTLIAGQRA